MLMIMPLDFDTLNQLYIDSQSCAKLIGLDYVADHISGITRVKHGKGFTYKDIGSGNAADKALKQRIAQLVIPPAWQEVWICPSEDGHILATGIDDKGRKQYIYHPKWRTMRDLIKFYRLIIFGRALPKIRSRIDNNLTLQGLSEDKVMAAMLWILDNAYIRIGNDEYFHENESVGLTTLSDTNVVIAGPVITLSFKGKSGKLQEIVLENPTIAKIINELRKARGHRLFRYRQDDKWHEISADDINHYLHDLTGQPISAKDFRTWGGTLIAFQHLIEENEAQNKKPEKAVVEAIDQAAAVLGNTRAVARSAYVHPHILSTYGSKDFNKYYTEATKRRKLPRLDKRETELLYFLEQLFEQEFNLLKPTPRF
jgi:DNA topoisomerase-1